MSGNIAIVPIETRTVELGGDELIAVLVEKDGKQIIHVPVNPSFRVKDGDASP